MSTERNTEDRPTLAAVIARVAADSVPDEVKVAALGRVVSYDRTRQVAEVQPVIDPIYEDANGDRVRLAMPSWPDVPVEWEGTKAASLHHALGPGDHVLLVIRDRSHDEVDDDGIPSQGTIEPKSTRRFSWSDAVAIPVRGGEKNGLDSLATHETDSVLFLEGARAVRVGTSNAALRLTIAEVLRPFLVDLVTWASTHLHPTSAPGDPTGATTDPPPSVPSIEDLASGRILVDT